MTTTTLALAILLLVAAAPSDARPIGGARSLLLGGEVPSDVVCVPGDRLRVCSAMAGKEVSASFNLDEVVRCWLSSGLETKECDEATGECTDVTPPADEAITEASAFFCDLFATSKDCGNSAPDECKDVAIKVLDSSSITWKEGFRERTMQFIEDICTNGNAAEDHARKALSVCSDSMTQRPGGGGDISITGGTEDSSSAEDLSKMCSACSRTPTAIGSSVGSVSGPTEESASSGSDDAVAPSILPSQSEADAATRALEPADATTSEASSSGTGEMRPCPRECHAYFASLADGTSTIKDKPAPSPNLDCPEDTPNCQTLTGRPMEPAEGRPKEEATTSEGDKADADKPVGAPCPPEKPECQTVTGDDVKEGLPACPDGTRDCHKRDGETQHAGCPVADSSVSGEELCTAEVMAQFCTKAEEAKASGLLATCLAPSDTCQDGCGDLWTALHLTGCVGKTVLCPAGEQDTWGLAVSDKGAVEKTLRDAGCSCPVINTFGGSPANPPATDTDVPPESTSAAAGVALSSAIAAVAFVAALI